MAGVKRSLAVMMNHNEGLLGVDNRLRPCAFINSSSGPEAQETRAEAKSNSSLDKDCETSPFTPARGNIPNFGSDASLALVGLRGCGKSTLAIMAASALKKKVINVEAAFQSITGTSSSSFKQSNGSTECRRRQADVLQEIMEQNPTGCIIVCPWMERRVQALLRQFSGTNPVIHVLRNADAIEVYMSPKDRTKARSLMKMSNLFYRSCTNLEFFNVSEVRETNAEQDDQDDGANGRGFTQNAPYLALKQAERHFLKFLSLIYPAGTIPFFESAFPLASIAPEDRQFTYCLSVHIRDILSGNKDWEGSIIGVDAVQIFVNDLLRAQEDALDGVDELANNITEAVGIVRRSTMLPILLHIKLPEIPNSRAVRSYLDLLSHTLSLAPEMLTVDLRLDRSDLSRVISAKSRSKIIGNYFASTDIQPWDSPSWMSWYQKACQLGCDMVRLVRLAKTMDDNFVIARFKSKIASLKSRKIPLIAYNSGHVGRHSSCFNQVLTLVAAGPATQSHDRCPPSAYVTAKDATNALYASFVYDAMKLYVFGANVGYSMSPAMHNAALSSCGIPHCYEPYSSESLKGVEHLIYDSHFGGASIGLPFKVEITTLTKYLSPHARAIGAANTLIPIRQLEPDGTIPTGPALLAGVNRAGPVLALYGENTDWIGIRACVRRGLSPANAVRPTTWGLIVGAGGMARAAVYAMLQVGITNIAIYNRTTGNAEKLVSHFQKLLREGKQNFLVNDQEIRFHVFTRLGEPWPSEYRHPSVIISCIPTHPIGNTPSPEFRLPDSWMDHQTGGVIIELGYKTLNTPLLKQARDGASRGWVAMDGLDLLPEQGCAQFELFTGRRAPRRVMRREILENYRDEHGKSHLEELQHRLQSIVEQDS
ncbi:quinate 5-dehydrogenase [Trichoderma cornu-damae]|uniref:Quinate 5-dehydrogenase n=1 Tax=Trichoderma cornu-damae TaxID=654480 RepID=A0A9P8QKY7_9HYPO|nr:quinate 5-dehydrogenase [Trichoderma cornu-damae]